MHKHKEAGTLGVHDYSSILWNAVNCNTRVHNWQWVGGDNLPIRFEHNRVGQEIRRPCITDMLLLHIGNDWFIIRRAIHAIWRLERPRRVGKAIRKRLYTDIKQDK